MCVFEEMKNNMASYDYLIKLIIVGDTAVGKTSLLLRFTEN
jgi:GTPase SAR1 family protein